MRLSPLFALSLGLVLSANSTNAVPIPYRIQFTTSYGVAPTAGSFLYDEGTVSSLAIEWSGAIFRPPQLNLGSLCGTSLDSRTPSVIAAALLGQPIGQCRPMTNWRAEWDPLPGGMLFFVLENLGSLNEYYMAMPDRSVPIPGTDPRALGGGAFRAVPADVPEPGTAALLLSGGLLLALYRKRSRQARSRTTPTSPQ